MSNPGNSDDDPESIAPVSSLRSKFESLAKTKTAPPAPPANTLQASKVRNTSLAIPNEPERGRASLDIPRSQLWGGVDASDQSVSSTSNNALRASPPQHQQQQQQQQQSQLRPPASMRQRPVSMGVSPFSPSATSLSPSASESSFGSPPNSGSYNKLSLPLLVPPTSAQAPQSSPRSPLPKKPPPPPPIQVAKQIESSTSVRLALPHADLASSSAKRLPPPINRMNKPVTPTNLLPPTIDFSKPDPSGGRSPFTTPPSSDDSPTHPHDLPQLKQRSGGEQISRAGYFPTDSSQLAVVGRRGSSAPTPRPLATQKDRQVSVPDGGYGGSDYPEDRPQLPARVRKDDSPARSGRLSAIDDTSETRKRNISPRPPPRPSNDSKGHKIASEFLPPPRRLPISHDDTATIKKPASTIKASVAARSVADDAVDRSSRSSSAQGHYSEPDLSTADTLTGDFPDSTKSNRRPPKISGVQQLYLKSDSRQFDICGRYCCTTGYFARVYDTSTGRMIYEMSNPDKEFKITAVVFKPAPTTDQEGQVAWLGNNYGEISELDIPSHKIVRTRSNAHNSREIIKMYRFQNSVWSLDEDGRLQVWEPGEGGTPSLQIIPQVYRVSRGHTCSLIVKHYLWFAAGKEIRVYNPMAGEHDFHVTLHPLHQASAGEVTSGTTINSQLDRVYFGHSDGKVSIYSSTDYSCLALVNASSYKINCLAGGGDMLWAGFGTGRIYVYDTRKQPWVVCKDWQAHIEPVSGLVVDKTTVWKSGRAVVASIGLDKSICLWDGWLEEDLVEKDLQDHDVEFCEFREIKAMIMTWNAGASTPGTLRAEDRNSNFFREIMQTKDPPDVLVFGFQELVDLEDKKLTAKTFFKGTKKKDPTHHEHMSRQYREWRDYLSRVIEDYMPANEPYTLLQTANLVGLFSCIFVKSSQRSHIRDLQTTEIKRGLGGLHGNKGAIILRFIFEDTSLCFANCHLAAGQSHTAHRNEDITAILETSSLPKQTNLDKRMDNFIGGGDGSMMMDHEICVINGDLNYRIDTMGRDTVIKAIKAGNLTKLLDRDQLNISKRRNPAFRLRAFAESPIGFAPTYKYDLGSDTYDTSEKSRSPAWCDRILFRGPGRIRQLQYRRHEGLRMSDHRPVSGTFLIRIKRIDQAQRQRVWNECEKRLIAKKQRLAKDARLDYLLSVLGLEIKEAQRMIS